MFQESAFRNTGYSRTVSLWSSVAIVALLIMVSSGSCVAEGSAAKACAKLGTGFINAVTCWVELPLRVYEKFRESKDAVYGACLAPTLGVLEGNTLVLGRLAGSVVDVTTFMAPWPLADYEPVMEPIWKRKKRDPALDTGT